MALANFLKVVTVTPNAGAPDNDVLTAVGGTTHAHIARTFNDSVPAAANISVSLNGQRLTTDTASKYYYTVSSLPAASVTITIYGNHSFHYTGYSSGTVPCSFTVADRISVEYTYQLNI